jgi:hypothetical protein
MTESASPFALDEAGELNLSSLQGFLYSTQGEFSMASLTARPDIVEALRYLEEKEPVRAALVRRCLGMVASLLNEAAVILNDGIDWPTVESWLCPIDEGFLDIPQEWFASAIARAEAEREQERQEQEEQNAPLMPPKLAELVNEGLTLPTPRKAALRSLGRSLRDEREREMRRFYAIAQKHGLVTGAHAGDAIRAALSQLFEIPIASRKDLTASQWSKAASALETEDLLWEVKPAPKAAPKAARNGSQNGTHNGQLNGTHNGHAPALHP